MNFPPNTEKHTSETQIAVVRTGRVQTDRVCLCVLGRVLLLPRNSYRPPRMRQLDPRPKVCCGANADGQFVSSVLVTVHKRP